MLDGHLHFSFRPVEEIASVLARAPQWHIPSPVDPRGVHAAARSSLSGGLFLSARQWGTDHARCWDGRGAPSEMSDRLPLLDAGF